MISRLHFIFQTVLHNNLILRLALWIQWIELEMMLKTDTNRIDTLIKLGDRDCLTSVRWWCFKIDIVLRFDVTQEQKYQLSKNCPLPDIENIFTECAQYTKNCYSDSHLSWNIFKEFYLTQTRIKKE